MEPVTLVIGSILSLVMIILVTPSIMRRNQGKALRNAAIWVGIFCLLALAYKYIGPGRDLQPETTLAAPMDDDEPDAAARGQEPQPPAEIDQDQGFLPPRE